MDWLAQDTLGAGVLSTARRYLDIQQQLPNMLPPGLAAVCVVARLEPPCLTLAVPSPAHAAKLRQMAPGIAQTLSARGWNISEVAVKVQAGLPRLGAQGHAVKTAQPLDANALQAFEALGSTLEPGPLADAVARLLAHHRNPGN